MSKYEKMSKYELKGKNLLCEQDLNLNKMIDLRGKFLVCCLNNFYLIVKFYLFFQ